jgi:hypothetical protein
MTTPNDAAEPSLASAGSHNTHMATARLSAANTWLQEEIKRLRLTDEEREAIDRVRIAFRDMDHNDMTRQQLEDYEAICHLLERVPLYAQPQALLAAEERDAVRWAGNMIPLMAHKGAAVAYCHAETLRKLDERLG